jgi:hypothetical protein
MHTDDDGDVYFHNSVTGETQWTRPEEMDDEDAEGALDAAAQKRKDAFLKTVGEGIDEEKMRLAMMTEKEREEFTASQAHEQAKSEMLKKQMQTFSASKKGKKKGKKGKKKKGEKGEKGEKKKKKKKKTPELE